MFSDRMNGIRGVFLPLVLILTPLSEAQEPPPAPAPAPPAAPADPAPVVGEVTANDVYVRSGPSLNHYTVTKLSAGQRVTIVGEQPEWYEILPPDGTFSLVSEQYVDTPDGVAGVINGENVRARAGSLLSEDKYTVQVMLSRGAQVRIIGRTADGFYKIAPPAGAALWISRQFVEVVPGTLVDLEAGQGKSSPGSPAGAGPQAATPTSAAGSASGASSGDLAAVPLSKHRDRLEELDQAMRSELEKPLPQRELSALIAQYQQVADQPDDELAGQYASIRVDQLKSMADMIAAVDRLRSLNESTEAERKEALRQRTEMVNPARTIPTGFDVQGELRKSAVFADTPGNRRYRLVDPRSSYHRTLAYVVIPEDSSINPDDFLGRYVGVRAIEKKLQTGLVDPVPVYVAAEIIAIEDSAVGLDNASANSAGP